MKHKRGNQRLDVCVVFWGIFRNRLVGKIRIHFVCVFACGGNFEQPFCWMSLGLKPSDLVQSYSHWRGFARWTMEQTHGDWPNLLPKSRVRIKLLKMRLTFRTGSPNGERVASALCTWKFYKLMALENKRARERMTMNDVMFVPDFFQKDQSTSIARQQSTIPKSTCFLQSFVSGSSESWSFNLW